MRHSAMLATTVATMLTLPLAGLSAQEAPSVAGTVTGTVTDHDKSVIHSARVRVVGTSISTETSADGKFVLRNVPAGHQTLELRLIGWGAKVVSVDVTSGRTLDLSIELTPLPSTLDTVRVGAVPGNFHLRGFEERREHGNGTYFTRKDIERMQARQVTDILRRAPGIRVENTRGLFGGGSSAQTSRSGSIGVRACNINYYLNGTPFPMSPDMTINQFLDPDAIDAIEVYAGTAQIPPQFNSGSMNSRCGLVVIWTRTGMDRTVKR